MKLFSATSLGHSRLMASGSRLFSQAFSRSGCRMLSTSCAGTRSYSYAYNPMYTQVFLTQWTPLEVRQYISLSGCRRTQGSQIFGINQSALRMGSPESF